jgi:ABC-type sugar transport system ATPase subunit
MLEVRNIEKSFRGVHALKNVSATFYNGEIHGLLGENGAGKSTLMKIVSGVYPADSGVFLLDGQEVNFQNPQEAYNAGIRIVHQELSLIPSLSLAENMFIHRFRRHSLRFVSRKDLRGSALKTLRQWGIDIDPAVKISSVSMGIRQLVEIARELSTGGKVIILDEPTSSLTFREIDFLFDVMRKLKAEGYTLIFISHRLNEVTALVDRITVLRDGEMVASGEKKEMSAHRIVSLIAGKEMDDIGGLFPKTEAQIGDVALEVKNLSGKGFRNISFQLHWGEILGVAGLVGAGRSELIRTIYGLQDKDEGEVLLRGSSVDIDNPWEAIEEQIVLLSESRGIEGTFPDLSVGINLIMLKIKSVVQRIFLNKRRIRTKAESLVDRLNIVTHNPHLQLISELSGGNQQKVVVGRLLGSDPRILLLDEPTRGVDVGNKTEIHRIIGRFVKEGGAVLMVSSELDELIGVSDRILVLHEGNEVGWFNRNEFDKEELLLCMMQVQRSA